VPATSLSRRRVRALDHPFTLDAGPARRGNRALRCRPSGLYTFPAPVRTGLGSGLPSDARCRAGRFPRIWAVIAPNVSTRAGKLHQGSALPLSYGSTADAFHCNIIDLSVDLNTCHAWPHVVPMQRKTPPAQVTPCEAGAHCHKRRGAASHIGRPRTRKAVEIPHTVTAYSPKSIASVWSRSANMLEDGPIMPVLPREIASCYGPAVAKFGWGTNSAVWATEDHQCEGR